MIETKFRLVGKGQIVGFERWNSIAGKWCYDISPNGVFDIRNPFIPHTDKNQFVELHDKLGVEIYEGDILVYRNNISEKNPGVFFDSYSVVCFGEYQDDNDLGTGWFLRDNEKGDYNSGLTDYFSFLFEVAGNIYENGELLK